MAAIHLQHLAVIFISAAAAAAAALPPPSCEHKCGDVDIPYPFGTAAGCHLDGFDITCNTSFRPPRPFIGDTSIELVAISLPLGQARAYKPVDTVCYNATAMRDFDIRPFNLSRRPAYRISAAHNKFTAIGCATVAFIVGGGEGGGSGVYESGCLSVCNDLASVRGGSCDGVDCCQTAIPDGLTSLEAGFAGGINNTEVWEFNPCSFSFVVESAWYKFSAGDLRENFNRTHATGVPLVLDWSVGSESCEEARRRSSAAYACVDEKSECFDSKNGPGYICNCSRGYEGNPYLANGCRDIDECSRPMEYKCYGICRNTEGSYLCSCPPGKTGDPTIKSGCYSTSKALPLYLKLLIAIISSTLFLAVLTLSTYLALEKRKELKAKRKFFKQNGGLIIQQQMDSLLQPISFKLFTLEQLARATRNFAPDRIIGRGGHGTVYKGTLDDARSVAVKRSKLTDEAQSKEFAKEMLILSQINHRNIVKLLGCCLEIPVPMLVYELIPNGNLFQFLRSGLRIPLEARLRIAAESAEALAYLHSSASTPIIHGDVKSSNILLDECYSAKVSDFGAAKLAPGDAAQLATLVQGTCGYLDPEYLLTCELTDKSDVYSFGVVVAELLARRRALEFDAASGEEMSLATRFVSAAREGKVEEMVDLEIRKEADMAVIKEVAQLAVLCLRFRGVERPAMREVAERLGRSLRRKRKQLVGVPGDEKDELLDKMAASSPGVSGYNYSGFYSLEAEALLSMEGGR